jgi:hypothetical protein
MDMQQPPLTQLDPNRMLMTRLTVQDWNIVLAALNEVLMPQRLTRPVTDNLLQQLRLQTVTSAEDVERALGPTFAERSPGSFNTAVGRATPDGP